MFTVENMKINSDFIHPKDVPTLLAASQQSFLAEGIKLQVRSFENADLYPADQHGALYVQNQAVFDSHQMLTPPRQSTAMKKWFVWAPSLFAGDTKSPTICAACGFILMNALRT